MIAAAVVFAAMVMAASWIEESRVLQSRAVPSVAPLVAANTPQPLVVEPAQSTTDSVQPTATSGENVTEPSVPVPVAVPAAAAHERPVLQPPPPSPSPQTTRPAAQPAAAPVTPPAIPMPLAATATPIQDIRAPMPVPLAAAPVARNTPDPAPLPAALPAVVPATPVAPPNVDELQVKQVLQRYRVAYEGLDAQSAQAVWPAVNQVALARAFDGLESQRLTFDACSVELQGNHALATCRGTARYVPKIGSRQPRVEPRIWSFALRKVGAEWKIDNARAER